MRRFESCRGRYCRGRDRAELAQNAPDAVGRHALPPVLVSQMWKLPVADKSLVVVVTGLSSQVPAVVGVLPVIKDPSVIVRVWLAFDHTQVAFHRPFLLLVPPVSDPRFFVSLAEQLPEVAVAPKTIVAPLIAQTVFVPLGPVDVVIGWLNVTMILSPVSSFPAMPPLLSDTEVATTPSVTAALGFPVALVHDPALVRTW